MTNKNCPNCGAPLDYNEDKCPYCGTYYLDLTGIDFVHRDPVYIKMRVEQLINGEFVPVTITQKAIPQMNEIEMNTNYNDITDVYGNVITRIRESNSCCTNVSFHAVPMRDGSLFHINLEDKS